MPETRGIGSRAIAGLLALEAASLATMSALHLTGTLDDGREPFDPTHAGIAEALICLALCGAAVALARRATHARAIATGGVGFAIAGFLVGLSFTISGGAAIDIAYHATVLPLLLLTLNALRRRRGGQGPSRTDLSS